METRSGRAAGEEWSTSLTYGTAWSGGAVVIGVVAGSDAAKSERCTTGAVDSIVADIHSTLPVVHAPNAKRLCVHSAKRAQAVINLS
jgi:hypothetical protein